MAVIQIRKKLTEPIPQWPELTPYVGETVTLTLGEEEPFECLETEETFFGLAPEQTPEEAERNMGLLRERARLHPEKYSALLEAIESHDIDVDAIILARGLQARTLK